MAEPFLSEIRIMSFVFAPKGWALCNGQLLPINQNQALFSLLGTTFGGDGRVNFALPDSRAHADSRGQRTHPRRERRRAGAHAFHRGVADAHPCRSTARRAIGNAADSDRQRSGCASAGESSIRARPPISWPDPASVANVGGSQAHLNMQPFLP